jgi:CarD family transcriptional regulator
MSFSVGDKVIHPIHGAGHIIEIKEEPLVAGFDHYCVIEIPGKRLTMHIPTNKMAELGVRSVKPDVDLKRVLDTLRAEPNRLPKDTIKRERNIREQIESGHSLQIAEAVRDLTWFGNEAGFTKVDHDLLDWGKELLAAEIAIITDSEIIEARRTIRTLLQGQLERASPDQ